MHYILNTVIHIPRSSSVRIGGPTIPGRPVMTKRAPTRGLMEEVVYTLSFIKKQDKSVDYTFKGSDGSIVVEKFGSCREADEFIAKIKGEALPNYSDFYERLRS